MNVRVLDRFLDRIERRGECVVWMASKNDRGYGQLHVPGRKMRYAHRLSYEHFVGEIGAGFEIDHLCRVPACVNPAHLEAVTHLENVRRGSQASVTACVNGHEFTPENTYVRKEGYRMCKACNRARAVGGRARRRDRVDNRCPGCGTQIEHRSTRCRFCQPAVNAAARALKKLAV